MKSRGSVAILFEEPFSDARQDELDVLVQAEAVSQALSRLNYQPLMMPVSLNVQTLIVKLKKLNPAAVFNLIESFNRAASLLHVVPSILESERLAYTGSDAAAIFCTTNKILTKQLLALHGIPTPPWKEYAEALDGEIAANGPVIIKPVFEDGSCGLDDYSVCRDRRELLEKLPRQKGNAVFVERFIEGREFNVSLLINERWPEVLPVAEMCFDNYPPGKPTVVGYKAKWDADSFDYHHTIRRFDFPPSDTHLLSRLRDLSVRCWEILGLDGYVRVDFRVDENGEPWVLEVNVNPCISPDSGFVAAAQQAGISYDTMIDRIVSGSCTRGNER